MTEFDEVKFYLAASQLADAHEDIGLPRSEAWRAIHTIASAEGRAWIETVLPETVRSWTA